MQTVNRTHSSDSSGAINICHIASGDLWAGAETVVHNLLTHLSGYTDLNVMAVLLNNGPLAEKIRALRLPVTIIDENQTAFWEICRRLRRIVREHHIDILHSHRYKENMLAYISSIALKGVSLVTTQHGIPELYDNKNNIPYRFKSGLNYRLMKRKFDGVVAVSNDIEKIFTGTYRFDPRRVSAIPNGIEIPEKVNEKGTGSSLKVGSAGRLFPVKDYRLFVEIANETVRSKKNVVFSLAGDGPDRASIENYVGRLGLEKTFLLKGALNNMHDFYEDLDIYVNTSIHEGIPMTVLEAMSHQLPIIAPKIGGIDEIVRDGVEGFLVPDRDAALFAEKIAGLLENRSLLKEMGIAARERVVSHFSSQQMAETYCNLYKKLRSLNRET